MIYTSDDWSTPADLAAALGEFDWDPCSNGRSHIRAKWRACLECGEDGLIAPWSGSVFCNPPYSNPLPWCERLRGYTGTWVALVKLDPTTKWWRILSDAKWEHDTKWAPFRKRLKFERPDKPPLTANFPSALFWSGRDCPLDNNWLWL